MSDAADIPPKDRRELLRPTFLSKGRARTVRRKMSLPEVLLWNELKANRIGFSFRRQHAPGPFIADFYCHECLLVVEVDGAFHYNQNEFDHNRDTWMKERGVNVKRIDAKSVLDSPAWAAKGIAEACKARMVALEARRTRTPHTTPGLEDSATPSASAEGDL